MINKKWFTGIIACFFLVSLYYFVNWEWVVGGYQSKKVQMEKDIRSHLLMRQGLSANDIYRIDISYNRKFSNYEASVIFDDEKELRYTYVYIDKQIDQYGFGGSEFGNSTQVQQALQHPKHIEK